VVRRRHGESIKREIEQHFERLLARPNLSVTVQEVDGPMLRCEAFTYATVPARSTTGASTSRSGGQLHQIEVQLKVAEIEVPGRAARSFTVAAVSTR